MTIFLADLSNHDWQRGPMNIASMVDAGIVGLTHKATDGDHFYRDPYIGAALNRARAASVKLPGAYHVLWNGNVTSQMDWFLSVVTEVAPWWRNGPFLWQLDCEPFGYNGIAPTLATIRAAADYLHAKTGMTPVVYAPRWVYGDSLTGLDYPLWASSYGTNPVGSYAALYPGDGSARWAPYSGQTPTLLQYGSRTIIGSQVGCDANAYRGSLAQLLALIGGHIEEDEMKTVLVRKQGTDAVFLSNGIHRWWIPNPDVLRDVTWVGGAGQLAGSLATTTIHEVGDIDAFGVLVGPDPAGTPAPPAVVGLSDTDRAAIVADLKAAVLGDLMPLIDLARRIGNG